MLESGWESVSENEAKEKMDTDTQQVKKISRSLLLEETLLDREPEAVFAATVYKLQEMLLFNQKIIGNESQMLLKVKTIYCEN